MITEKHPDLFKEIDNQVQRNKGDNDDREEPQKLFGAITIEDAHFDLPDHCRILEKWS